MIETGTLLQERYLIERQIGEGGMGAVYLAVDKRFDNYVAIKETFFSDDEFGQAFEREARLLNGLQHPVLPHVTDFFTENNGYFLVMQFIEGEDLSSVLKRDQGGFPIKDVLRWTDDLLDALDYLHSQQPPIIHRDIKPQNLKLTARGGIILLDFGLAKLKHEDTSGVKSVFGYSRRYSPLEQIQGTGTDARSDIFSLGSTVYSLLTGKPPLDVLARATHIIAGKPDPLRPVSEINPEVPFQVAAVLQSAMALNPEQRFVTAEAMRKALNVAANPDSAKNASTENLAVAAAMPVVGEVETENFPALEAFVEEVNHTAEAEPAAANAPPVVVPIESQHAAEAENFQTAVIVQDTIGTPETYVLRPVKRRFNAFPAVAAVILVLALVAGGYFIQRSRSAGVSAETPAAQTEPEVSNIEPLQQTETEAPVPENSESALPNESALVKKKDVIKQKTAEKPETVVNADDADESVTSEAENQKPEPVTAARTTSTKPQRVSKPADKNDSRRVEEEPVPDIESVFTGEPSWEKRQQRREQRQLEREILSEEEWRRLRRERRERRARRQNSVDIPF